MADKRYVRPAKSGWDVLAEGHRRGTVRTATKKEAEAQARRLVREHGGGEVRVLNAQGKVTKADTVKAPKRRTQAR